MAKRTPMMEQYLAIKQSYEDALLFFRLGDFYELFFRDAEIASELLELTLTGRGAGEQRMPMCGVPYHAADGYIARLVATGHKVAVCDQVEDPRAARGLVKREVTRVITPGTAYDFVRDGQGRPLVAAFASAGEEWEAVVADALTGDIWVRVETFDALCAWLTQAGVAEVVASRLADEQVVARSREYALRAKIAFSLFADDPAAAVQHDGAFALSGHALVVRYLEYTGKRALGHLKEPVALCEDAYVTLTASALSSLELLRPMTPGRKGATLWETLDFTSCSLGKRSLRAIIERPLRDLAAISERQDAIAHLLSLPRESAEMQAELKDVHDMERIVSRVSFGSVTPRDLLNLARSLQAAGRIGATLGASGQVGRLHAVMERLDEFPDLVSEIVGTLQDDVAVNAREGMLVRPGVNEKVDRLRDIVQGGRSHIAALEQAERARTGVKSLKIGYNRVFGYYIEVSNANEHLIPPDYERKQTLAGAERYVTPELRQWEAEIADADEQLKELEWSIFSQLAQKTGLCIRGLQACAEAVGELDALLSLAAAASRHRYVRPIVDDSQDIEIVGGRHPVVERHVDGGFVPNDSALSCGQRQIALITGPNMAGKSTYMRQLALIVLMAQMGGYVPADSARVGLVDRLYTRIGASDDVSAGLSTFMMEMNEAAEILRGATDRSLIVLDEIGRGTATYDGMSIAEAIVEHIHESVGARTLFATHYHELTSLPLRLPRVFNLSVAVAERGDEIIFLHRIVARPADRSYGIQVAQLAGLPESVTLRAKHILRLLETGGPAAFAHTEQIAAAFEEPSTRDCEALWTELAGLPLDEWTPRDALAYLYGLQARSEEGA
ncbi:MAG: DNA mismatch repair protein MutS [Bacilli bacterium]